MPSNDNGKPVVLFVDDERRVLESLRRVLMRQPFRILTAKSGRQALEMLSGTKVDVVVSDEKMPGMSGSEFLTEVRQRYPDIARIMLTGHADINAAIQAINEGRIYRFLLKPVSPDELASVIRNAIQEQQQSDRLLEFSQLAGGVCSFEVLFSKNAPPRIKWSENARALLRLPPEASLDNLEILYNRLHPDDVEDIRGLHESCLDNRGGIDTEYRVLLFNDRIRWISQTSDLSVSVDGTTTRLLSVLKDITDLKWQQERLEHQAFHDALTGLGNRALLLDWLHEALSKARAENGHVALLYIDLDDFKLINDSMGHIFGDWLLQAFAQRLSSIRCRDSLAARLGGDEFALVMRVTDMEQLRKIVFEVLDSLKPPFSIGDYELHMSGSIGVSLSSDSHKTGLDLLRDADTAMYAAKSKDKGAFRFFDQSMHETVSERFLLVSEMHKALTRDEFHLVFQPIVRLDNLTVAGFEALVRWKHPKKGLIMPEKFIPLAEDSGLITRLGRLVMQKACEQAGRWNSACPDTRHFMSINVAVQQLRQANFVQRLEGLMKEFGLDPSLIKVEITESGLMEDVRLSLSVMSKLKELGVRLQIDDFGTGYSSLSYLQRIPADNLKVDKSFVIGMERDEEKRILVRTVIDLAHGLGLKAVAEGVELPEHLELLRGFGCDYGQGYLFDKPLAPEEAAQCHDYSHCL